MKELLKALEAAEITANAADAAWEADPENGRLETAFDEAYKAECEAFAAVVDKIVSITSGRIDRKTAATMLRCKRKDIESLVARMA